MPNITLNNDSYPIQPEETVLDCLLNAGLDMLYGCKAGTCQSCMLKLDDGVIDPSAQEALSPAQKKLGYFLPCLCKTTSDLQLSSIDHASLRHPSKIRTADRLNSSIVRLRLEKVFDYIPGQFISIWLPSGGSRSYSIASAPNDDFIELHVKRIDGGAFSEQAYDTLKTGDTLNISGPLGHCVYACDSLDEPLLLSGIGTGLAPLYGVLRNALDQGHNGDIYLILGARTSSNFYLVEELLALQQQTPKLTVQFISQTDKASFAQQGDIYQRTKELVTNTKNFRIYLCGAESFVKKMRKQCFLNGAAMDHIHADPFTASGH